MVVITELSPSSYDVFLSFRGVDTRLSFVDHLHHALIDANLKTFLDDDEIETGDDLRPELKRAIRESRASVIVLSTNYASSTWCLDELVLILERRLTSDHLVIPIFYHVEPTHVRKQESSFGVAMEEHKRRLLEAEANTQKRSPVAEKINGWSKALTEVAQVKGKDAKSRYVNHFQYYKKDKYLLKILTILQGLGSYYFYCYHSLVRCVGVTRCLKFILK
ncbi:hypothetical protein SSX86_008276 [Deinandra increscens subsp. villosa]|uniref:TIR domain-containing protein n=1 Tax=Deinandra increscens subsp. villosa TaxID=3103831 RepID=A0AAP0DAZ8_9ASTR